jgi:CXXC-20-CXXC protein
MPRCQNCNHQWSWETTVRKSFTLGVGMECPNCGTRQYLTKKSRKKTGIINIFPAPILILTALFFDLEITTMLVFAVGLFAAFMAVYPHLVELSNENEPMW